MSTEGKSIAYQEGVRARKEGVKLTESAIKNLRVGSSRYEDFLAGYDSAEAQGKSRRAQPK